jgi:CMP-N-acetylneuraminic acid synthetase
MDNMVTLNAVAVIPARGGSKRIPRKNIRPFAGQPMIGWTIEAARNSGIFDRVLISTDDPEIARVGEQLGVQVPFLRDCASDDHAPVSEAVVRSLEQAEEMLSEQYRSVALLMPNCPLRNAADVREGWAAFIRSGGDFQISFFEPPLTVAWWAYKLDQTGRPSPVFPEAIKKRSQDLDRVVYPTGALWVAKTDSLRKTHTFYGPDFRAFVVRWQAGIDIDTEADWQMAEAVRLIQDARRSP